MRRVFLATFKEYTYTPVNAAHMNPGLCSSVVEREIAVSCPYDYLQVTRSIRVRDFLFLFCFFLSFAGIRHRRASGWVCGIFMFTHTGRLC